MRRGAAPNYVPLLRKGMLVLCYFFFFSVTVTSLVENSRLEGYRASMAFFTDVLSVVHGLSFRSELTFSYALGNRNLCSAEGKETGGSFSAETMGSGHEMHADSGGTTAGKIQQ